MLATVLMGPGEVLVLVVLTAIIVFVAVCRRRVK